MNGDVTKLSKYGTAGIALALVMLLGYFLKMHFSYINMAEDNMTDTLNDLIISNQRLVNAIDNLDETVEDFGDLNMRIKTSMIEDEPTRYYYEYTGELATSTGRWYECLWLFF